MDLSELSRSKVYRLLLVPSIIATVCLLVYFLTMYAPPEDDGPERMQEIDDHLLYEVLYNESYLGYNSVIYGGGVSVGLPDDLKLIDTSDLSLPIYCYPENELTEEYIEKMVERFFPEIDVDNMTVGPSSVFPASSYFIIENDTVELRILKNGGLEYEVKTKLGTGDVIGSKEKAMEMAESYLKNHGGLPDDIDRARSSATCFENFSAEGSYLYSVKFYRNTSEYTVQGFSMRNKMILKFDGSDGSLVFLEWHWPELTVAYNLTNIPAIKDTLKHYGMDSNSSYRQNITTVSITYSVPCSVQKSAYDVSAEIYFLAPYWVVSTESHMYYLGMTFSEEG